MKKYLTKQLVNGTTYEQADFLEDVGLRQGLYNSDQLSKYCEKMFSVIGQKILYFIVVNPNDVSLVDGRAKQTLIKVYENDLEKLESCLEYINGDEFPVFNIMDMETYKAAYADCKRAP